MLRVLSFLCLLALSSGTAQSERPLTVFAAASLSEAMERIGIAFERQTGVPVVFSFAGTGTLARQIEAGAPADVFVSADEIWMDYAVERGAVDPAGIHTIAGNSLVVIAPHGGQALDLTAAALSGRLGEQRMAMADPETVPAGRYGRAALEGLGLWALAEGRLATMENVRIVLASVARGDTPLGVVYATDAAIEPGVDVVAALPQKNHPEIVYPAALTAQSQHAGSAAFLAFLTGGEAQKILRSFGFITDNVR